MSASSDPAVRRAYHIRTLRQITAWANGLARHNEVDDECCPDMSCCHPVLAEPDMEQRLATLRTYARLLREGRLL
jgi:hypothetical protein